MATAVLKWVETGTVPVSIEGSRVTGDKLVRTRPLRVSANGAV
jgi:hypothetical protein